MFVSNISGPFQLQFEYQIEALSKVAKLTHAIYGRKQYIAILLTGATMIVNPTIEARIRIISISDIPSKWNSKKRKLQAALSAS